MVCRRYGCRLVSVHRIVPAYAGSVMVRPSSYVKPITVIKERLSSDGQRSETVCCSACTPEKELDFVCNLLNSELILP